MTTKKLDSLEGVRALACISVVLCHLWGAFAPNLKLAATLSHTPLYYLYSGNTAVRIMFVLSGFVLSYKYFYKGHTEMLERDAVKRYLRLALPATAATLIAYCLMRLNLMFNVQAAELTGSQNFLGLFNRFPPSLSGALKDSLYVAMFQSRADYVSPLWTMAYELLGSYLVFGLTAVLKSRRARYLFYLLFLFLFPAYYIYFVLGMFICDLYTAEKGLNQFLQKHGWMTIALHIAAWCYIGMVDGLDVVKWKSLLFDGMVAVMFLTLLNSPILDRLWGNPVGVHIGKHGFSIYLLHWPVIESFSCAYLCAMTAWGYGHRTVLLTNVILSMAVIYIVSVIFTRLIVQPSAVLSDKAAAWILNGKKGESLL